MPGGGPRGAAGHLAHAAAVTERDRILTERAVHHRGQQALGYIVHARHGLFDVQPVHFGPFLAEEALHRFMIEGAFILLLELIGLDFGRIQAVFDEMPEWAGGVFFQPCDADRTGAAIQAAGQILWKILRGHAVMKRGAQRGQRVITVPGGAQRGQRCLRAFAELSL